MNATEQVPLTEEERQAAAMSKIEAFRKAEFDDAIGGPLSYLGVKKEDRGMSLSTCAGTRIFLSMPLSFEEKSTFWKKLNRAYLVATDISAVQTFFVLLGETKSMLPGNSRIELRPVPSEGVEISFFTENMEYSSIFLDLEHTAKLIETMLWKIL